MPWGGRTRIKVTTSNNHIFVVDLYCPSLFTVGKRIARNHSNENQESCGSKHLHPAALKASKHPKFQNPFFNHLSQTSCVPCKNNPCNQSTTKFSPTFHPRKSPLRLFSSCSLLEIKRHLLQAPAISAAIFQLWEPEVGIPILGVFGGPDIRHLQRCRSQCSKKDSKVARWFFGTSIYRYT